MYAPRILTIAAALAASLAPIGLRAQGAVDLTEPDDPFTRIVLIGRMSYATCAQKVQKSLADAELAELTARLGNRTVSMAPDLSAAEACVKSSVEHVGRLAAAARQSANKRKTTIQAIDQLERANADLLLAITPSGDETKNSYSRRVREAKLALKKVGDTLLMESCDRKIDCVMNRSTQVRDIERTGMI